MSRQFPISPREFPVSSALNQSRNLAAILIPHYCATEGSTADNTHVARLAPYTVHRVALLVNKPVSHLVGTVAFYEIEIVWLFSFHFTHNCLTPGHKTIYHLHTFFFYKPQPWNLLTNECK